MFRLPRQYKRAGVGSANPGPNHVVYCHFDDTLEFTSLRSSQIQGFAMDSKQLPAPPIRHLDPLRTLCL